MEYKGGLEKKFEEEFDKFKKETFSNFCLTKCDSRCCDSTFMRLMMHHGEIKIVYGKEPRPDGRTCFRTNISNVYEMRPGHICPKLDKTEGKCVIYQTRPFCCKQYPFKRDHEKNAIVIDKACLLSEAHLEFYKLKNLCSKYEVGLEKEEETFVLIT